VKQTTTAAIGCSIKSVIQLSQAQFNPLALGF
jgi:hypothetical protein